MPVDTVTRDLALSYQAQQARRARQVADHMQELWRRIDPRDLTASWQSGMGWQMVSAVTAGQVGSADGADDYVDAVTLSQGAVINRAGRARTAGFAGTAADGRSLLDLMYLPVITTKMRIAAGQGVQEAMLAGLRQALTLSASEVMQAGRGAVGASMVGQRTIQGYVRVVTPPACSRCVVLAGREYGWNRGFLRHPHCDCYHLPTTLVARNQRGGFLDPSGYFRSLSRSDQDRIFTAGGAQAIRDGANLTSVVNARRSMYTTEAYGRTVRATRDSVTRRGAFYRSERQRAIGQGRVPASGAGFRPRTPRLLPEEIYRLAESRDEAIAMLRRFGYLT
jgi:hypothetical protein